MNILLTSVGRRSYMVRYFQAALKGKGRVIAANSVTDASGMMVADGAYKIPVAGHPDYIGNIMDICRQEDIGMLCSLHDWEGPFLSAHLKEFEEIGVRAIVSSPEVITICLDKMATMAFCRKEGIPSPKTWGSLRDMCSMDIFGKVDYPLMLKPRFGQGSIELHVVENEQELSALYALSSQRLARYTSNGLLSTEEDKGLLIQEWVQGTEYGLDVVNDLYGKPATCFVKRKLCMRAGETDIAETVQDTELEALGLKIGAALGHIGVLDVDVILGENGPFVLEMNARFGGHYPFAHEAGANIPAALIAWAEGDKPNPQWMKIRPGIRCCKDICMVRMTE